MSIEARKIRLLMHLRRSGITDHKVLGALERVPRELFVPDSFFDQAYEDRALPIGHGQTISQPLVVAYMTQLLEVGDMQKVLEIGTGSGYQACILAKLCRRLYTVERHRPLLEESQKRFDALRLHNVTTRLGDGTKGWPEQAPFDRIIVTAAAGGAEPPTALTDQLGVGGIMVVPIGEAWGDQRIVRLRRTETGVDREDLWPVRFVPLVPNMPENNE
jgi:protein-L-isoaspartate(D-aspartate) O-methyltransferase